jgi:hypothetical protein
VARDRRQSERRCVAVATRLLALATTSAYCALASRTTPFTDSADIVTALPIAVAALAFVLRITRHDPTKVTKEPLSPRPRRWPWCSLVGAFAVWELFSYFEQPRSEHPTISSLYDGISNIWPLKAAVFFSWLALGWFVLCRTTRTST